MSRIDISPLSENIYCVQTVVTNNIQGLVSVNDALDEWSDIEALLTQHEWCLHEFLSESSFG